MTRVIGRFVNGKHSFDIEEDGSVRSKDGRVWSNLTSWAADHCHIKGWYIQPVEMDRTLLRAANVLETFRMGRTEQVSAGG